MYFCVCLWDLESYYQFMMLYKLQAHHFNSHSAQEQMEEEQKYKPKNEPINS